VEAVRALNVYYSMHGHVHRMAEGAAEGVLEVPGEAAALRREPVTHPEEVPRKMRAFEARHGGQESTIPSTHVALPHQGTVVAGLPHTFRGRTRLDGITGGPPYGAGTIAGGDGKRSPSENEPAAARFQGKHVASLAARLVK
jgi:multimeric flavodoxin WrbA